MENGNNNGIGYLFILAIIIIIALAIIKDEHKKQTDAIQDEIRQLRTELEQSR